MMDRARSALAAPIGMLGPPVLWSLHLLIAYFIVTAFGDSSGRRSPYRNRGPDGAGSCWDRGGYGRCRVCRPHARWPWQVRAPHGPLYRRAVLMSTLFTALPAFALKGFS